MPNRPTYPRIALPPALALRCDALRALAPTGRPSRQAVVERALTVGLGVLEGGPSPPQALVDALERCWFPRCGRPATRCHRYADDLTCDDCDTGYKNSGDMLDLPYAAALRAFQGARPGPDAPAGAPTPADAPTGHVGPALARRVAPPLPIYLTTTDTAPWGVEVGRATVTGLDVPGATAEDDAAAEAVNRGRGRRTVTRVVG